MKSEALYWCEQSRAQVPSSLTWLSREEAEVFESLKTPKRKNDWLLGRWTAKGALEAYLRLSGRFCRHSLITIRARADGSPEIVKEGRPSPQALSISHSGLRGLAVIREGFSPLGCDLELIEPRTSAFLETFCTKEEEQWVLQLGVELQPLAATLIWSAKESALKALREGLRRDTRDVEIEADVSRLGYTEWKRLKVRFPDSPEPLEGWWVTSGEYVRTLVAAAPFEAGPDIVHLDANPIKGLV